MVLQIIELALCFHQYSTRQLVAFPSFQWNPEKNQKGMYIFQLHDSLSAPMIYMENEVAQTIPQGIRNTMQQYLQLR